jgi:pyruvate dehydrogenase E2 component (dihydrolipoamide acetyltransferase)
MSVPFAMPKLGLTMEEATILAWLVPDGAVVTAGTLVLRIETDKVETDVEVPSGGVLRQQGQVGGTYRCGEPLGTIESADGPVPGSEDLVAPAGPAAAGTGTTAPGRLIASPNARRVARELGVDLRAIRGSGPGGRIVSEDVEASVSDDASAPTADAITPDAGEPVAVVGGVPASPAAAQLADLLGVQLSDVRPSAPDGRVSRQDVADHVRSTLAGGPPAAASVPAAASARPSSAAVTPSTVPLTGMRGTIARRMHASLQQMAQLTLTMDVDMDALWAERDALGGDGVAPGFTAYVIAACARALRTHPIVNSTVTDAGIELLDDIHIGMATAVPGGLVVPVVRHADRLRLEAIGAETVRLAAAARTGALSLADLEGGTFAVTSLGMYGVDAFTPVINPPNAAILGVGRIRDEVAWSGDGFRRARRMTLSLTWDHRVLDGAPAAEFCRSVKAHLEAPTALH